MFHGRYKLVTLPTRIIVLISILSCELGLNPVLGTTDIGESSSARSISSTGRQYPHSSNNYANPSVSSAQSGGGTAQLNQEEDLRKEIIKVQILQRLGLSEKPHVDLAHKISKDLVLETLRRTENLESLDNSYGASESTRQSHLNSSTSGDDDSLSIYAKTSEIIAFPDKGPELNGHTLLSFSYAGNNAYGVGVRVKKAHLWVKMEYMSSIGRHFGHLLHPKGVNLYIFQVNGNFSHKGNHYHQKVHLNGQEVNLELVVSRTVLMDSLGWQKLDITAAVQKWYNRQSRHRVRHPHSNHNRNHHRDKLTLLVDCAGCGHSIHPITFSRIHSVIPEKGMDDNEGVVHSHDDPNSLLASSADSGPNDDSFSSRIAELDRRAENLTEIPFLVLETESSPNFKRSRRRALECSPRVKHCCKQRFYISFQDLGWDDWIIAPKGYYANYCRGHCGGPHRTPDTFLNYHTHVLEEYKRTPEGQANLEGITPCCSPTKFAPMSLIYFGPELNIIKRDLPKMIVEECGCP